MKHLLPLLLGALALPVSAQAPKRDFPTIHDFLELGGRTRVIAHRGFSGVAPENTLVAMQKAIDLGADMIEIDVTLTADNIVILLHDETLDRTTDGVGRALDIPLDTIRGLDAGSWFAPEYAGEPVPTLKEALELVKGRILLNIEIKGEAVTDTVEGGLVDRVLQEVKAMDLLDQVIISSFEPKALAQARQLSAEVRTASLYEEAVHKGLSPLTVMEAVGSNGFNLSRQEVNREIVETCHGAGRPVAVYTVNEVEEMRRLIDLGVNAFFTDFPDRLLELLAEERK
jgi:glycerophosphoryl diester phosphodiesterase